MRASKNHLVGFVIALTSISSLVFVATGYTALYWAWLRRNLEVALPYLPWARNFGMLAIAGAAAALILLFLPKTFPILPRLRLALSILATATIALFSEFRNDGKFHLKNLIHFFGPGTWIHDGLNQLVSSSGDFLYRMEYSHWNDFLMGPAIVSVLFCLVFVRIYGALFDQAPVNLSEGTSASSTQVDDALRFARILMNVGLFWLFIQAWAEKAGYLSNPHSVDEIDLPFEFAGTMLGFWMTRVLTKPFAEQREKFGSTLLIDFVCSGVIGLLYTIIVGPLTEHVASDVAHALSPVVPHSLDVHEYTPFQRHMRPFELLLLAGTMWWGLNASSKHHQMMDLSSTHEEPEGDSKWDMLLIIAKASGVTAGYLIVVVAMLSILEPQGVGWTLATAAPGMGVGSAALLLVKRAEQQGLITVFGTNDDV
jgi:hypothetical protein